MDTYERNRQQFYFDAQFNRISTVGKPAEYGVTTGERNENIKLRTVISREFQ